MILAAMLLVVSPSADIPPTVFRKPLVGTNGLWVGCPGLPATIAAEPRGGRVKLRKLNELPPADAYAAMLRTLPECSSPAVMRKSGVSTKR